MDRLLVLAMLASVTLSAAGLVFESAEWMELGPVGGWDPSHITHVAVVLAMVALGASALVWVRKLWEEMASRTRAEARALAAGERHQGLVNSLDGIVWEADPGDFKIKFVSKQCERFLGYPAERWLTDLTWKDLIHPGDYDRVIETCVREVSAGRNHTLEYRMVASDGRVVWFRDVTTLVTEEGRPVKLLGILVDITERKQAEEALRESEENFRLLTENIPEIFFIVEPETGRTAYTSPAFEKVWGRNLETAYRSAWAWMEAVHPEDLPALREKIRADLDAPEGYHHSMQEFRILRPDGSVRWIRSRAFPVRGGPGRPLRIVGLASDITESKQLQDQLRQAQKLEAVGQLAGGVAHELNNPLQAIMAYSNILERKIEAVSSRVPEAEQCRKTVNALREATERSAKIVRGLLSFARKDGVSMTTVDLNDLARSTAGFLDHTLGLQEVHVELDLGPGPLLVRGNPVALQQALTNLLINARDAMPGGGTVTLRTRRENGSVEIAVANAGSGMAPEVRARLFEPFFTTKPPGEGTGLGLSITYGIVKEHGGSIGAESEPGKGSTFTIRLPAVAGPGPAGTPGVAEAQP